MRNKSFLRPVFIVRPARDKEQVAEPASFLMRNTCFEGQLTARR